MTTGVVHLASESLGIEPLRTFLDSYWRHAAGARHELVVVHNGVRSASPSADFVRALADTPHRSLVLPSNVIDLAAYARAAQALSHPYLCLLNSTSEVCVDGWLGKLMRHARQPDVGLTGATASLGTALEAAEPTERAELEHLFHGFPNPHIRTNAIVIARELLLALRWPHPATKREAHALEHGRDSITNQVLARGLRCVVVGRDGRAYEPDQWAESRTFWIGEQENLLVADRRTREYAEGDAHWRGALRRFAWGDPGGGVAVGREPAAPAPGATIRLSICIPTHHGRASALQCAIRSVLDQAGPSIRDEIEVCVSDNASSDGTAQMIDELRSREPVRIVYSRNERDLGLTPNMLRAVEIASGKLCWLFGSDDEMVDGALDHVLALADRFPHASGYCVNWANFGADLAHRGERDAPEVFPSRLETQELRGFETVVGQLGLMFGYISCNVVRRDRWLTAARDFRRRVLEHPTWPQVRIMGEIARRDPRWIFSPLVVVRNRTSTGWVLPRANGARDYAKMHIDLVDGLDSVWGELTGEGSPLHRQLMRRSYRMCASGKVVWQIKLLHRSGVRREIALLRSFARAFWWHPAFWHDACPRLLVPAAVPQALDRYRRRPGGTTPPLSATVCRTRVAAEVPPAVPSRHMLRVPCTLRNAGSTTLVSRGDHPVRLAYRWLDPATGRVVLEGLRAELTRPLRSGRSTRLELPLLTPWSEGDYALRIAPVQEFVHWFDDLDPENGVAVGVQVRHPN